MTSTVLQALQEPGRAVAIAAVMGVSESTVSRLKNEHLESLCELLAHAGLKIVPVEVKCFPAEKIEALLTLAKAHLAGIETADDIIWTDGASGNAGPGRGQR
jgi:hypothetical protein